MKNITHDINTSKGGLTPMYEEYVNSRGVLTYSVCISGVDKKDVNVTLHERIIEISFTIHKNPEVKYIDADEYFGFYHLVFTPPKNYQVTKHKIRTDVYNGLLMIHLKPNFSNGLSLVSRNIKNFICGIFQATGGMIKQSRDKKYRIEL